MSLIIDSWESDGEGGFYIQWTDSSQPVTAYIHATPDLMDEFVIPFRRNRAAPTAKLDDARDGMRDSNLSDAATVQLFRRAYEELLDDIIDLRERELKSNTPHAVLEDARSGRSVPVEWKRDKTPAGFKAFIERGGA